VESVDALKQVATDRGLICKIRRHGRRVGHCFPRLGIVDTGARQLKLLFVRHPSQFFSWENWSPVIRDNLSLSFGT
jgi:hypothetical protein